MPAASKYEEKRMRSAWLCIGLVAMLSRPATAADEYTIAGQFDGCEYGKLYELDGGGILECQEYNYYYEYQPRVIASGREVIVIGDEKVSGYLHDGSVYRTNISDDFEGCDCDKVYMLDNGLLFQCSTYRYHYSYRPEVAIFVIHGRRPVVFIDGDEYSGTLFRAD